MDGDSYYVFSASDGQSHTLTVMIESEPVSVIKDSGATCNLMSENVFYKVSQGKTELSKTDRKIHAYASQQPLKLSGKCLLKVFVPDTQTSLRAEFFVMPGNVDTLLGKRSSEELGILKVGMFANYCESEAPANETSALKARYPQVFTGLGKLKDF